MTKTRLALLAGAALALVGATAIPALAVEIRKTNRAEGDPAAASMPHRSDEVPADTTGPRNFDKRHDGAN